MGLLDTPGATFPEPALTVDQQIALQHAKAAENAAAHLEAISSSLVSINNMLAEDFRERHGRYPGSQS
jgi:hypothetical protein